MDYSSSQDDRVLGLLNRVSLQVSGYEIHLYIETILFAKEKLCTLLYVSVILCRKAYFIRVSHMSISWFTREKAYHLWEGQISCQILGQV